MNKKNMFNFLLITFAVIETAYSATAPIPTLKVTYNEMQSYFDNRPAKMIISMTKDIQNANYPNNCNDTAILYLLDFTKNPLQTEVIIDSAVAMFGDPALSYDGTRVAFGRQGANKGLSRGIYLCEAKAGGPGMTLIDPNGFAPTWWIHPQTGDEYLIWVNTPGIGWGSLTEANGITANTYIRKLVKGTTTFAEPAKILVTGFAFRHGRSPDGKYMVTNWPGWEFIEIDPNVTENATIKWLYHGDSRICMGNISRNLSDPMNSLWFDLNHLYVSYDIWVPRKITYPPPFTSGQYNRWANNGDFFTNCLLNNSVYDCTGGHPECATTRQKVSFECNSSINAAAIYKFSTREWKIISKGSRATALWVATPAQRCQTPTLIINNTTVPADRYYNFAFKTKANVKLVSPDGAKIKYTTNDTLPVAQWTEYTGPFELTSTSYLSFIALSNNLMQMDNSGILKKGIAKSSNTYEGLVFASPTHSLNYNSSNQFMNIFDKNDQTAFMPTYPINYDAFCGFDLGAPRAISKITFRPRNAKLNTLTNEMIGGKFQGSNTSFNAGYEDIANVGVTTINQDNVISVTSGKKYRYVRYLFPRSVTLNNVLVSYPLIAELDMTFSDVVDTSILASPIIQPLGGTFTNTIQVSMSHVNGADIFYTTNNADPTSQSTKYSAPLNLNLTTTIKAVAIQNGKTSPVQTAIFTKTSGSVQTPVITATSNSFTDSISVSISSNTSGAVIYYTLDGSNPLSTSSVYSKPLILKSTTVVKSFATAPGLSASSIAYKNFVKVNQCDGKAGKVIWPNGGEVIRADSLNYFKWICCDESKFYQAVVYISFDGGRTIGDPLINNSIEFTSDTWGRFPFRGENVPDNATTAYTNCRFMVYQYGGGLIDASDNSFTIIPQGVSTIKPVGKKLETSELLYLSTGTPSLRIICKNNAIIQLLDLQGKVFEKHSFTGYNNRIHSFNSKLRGVYIIKATIDNSEYIIRNAIFR